MTSVTQRDRRVHYREWVIPGNGLWGASFAEVLQAISQAKDELGALVNGSTDGKANPASEDQIRVFAGDDEIIVRIEISRELDESSRLEFRNETGTVLPPITAPSRYWMKVPSGASAVRIMP